MTNLRIIAGGKAVDTSPFFVLVDDWPVPVPTVDEWHKGEHHRQIGHAEWYGVRVATEFIGLHNGTDSEPRLFMTKVLNGPWDAKVIRRATFDEARKLHAQTCLRVFGFPPQLAPLWWLVVRTWRRLWD
jgi:hypothetical protein